MTPPQVPQRQEGEHNPLQEQVAVLRELQGTLVHLAQANLPRTFRLAHTQSHTHTDTHTHTHTHTIIR